jgi:type VI secretion system protein ImpK
MLLSDCFMEIIAYTTAVIRSDTAAQPVYEQVQNTMQQLISQSEAMCTGQDVSEADYQLARFAVFAWVDETLLASPWEGRHQWQRDPLQRNYYQTTDAGELFFEHLNTLGPHQRDVREVYYLCLCMGFTGQYGNPGDDFMLEQLRISNLKLLTGSSMGVPTLDKESLFPEAYPAKETAQPSLAGSRRWSPFTMAGLLGPLLLYALLYLIYVFILGSIGNTLISTVG